MSSWGFLIKRIIHTVITLLIVLVLLFIIFRMMPGDPARFFIKPGMAPEAYHLIAVKYGFEKVEFVPGDEYEVNIKTDYPGAYGLQLTASDDSGQSAVLYGTYLLPGTLAVDDNTSLYSVSASSQPALNSPVALTLELDCEISCPSQVPVNLTHEGGTHETMMLALSRTYTVSSPTGMRTIFNYSGTSAQSISEYGNYFVEYNVSDQIGIPVNNIFGFSVNGPSDSLEPFSIWNLRGELTRPGSSKVIASVTSTSNVHEVNLTFTSPISLASEEVMYRSRRFVQVPIWEQFVIYMKNMLSFDFGTSFVSSRPVWDEIAQRVPPTLLLFGSALLLSAVFGIMFGVVMAWRRGSKLEIFGIVVSLFFYAMPIFWFGLILLAFFAAQLGWFPLGGLISTDVKYQGLDYVMDLLKHLTLPLLTLTIAHLAGWMLLMRNSMLEVMGEDYITTAKAKGLSEGKVMYRHAARNAMLPIVTAIALSLGGVVGGGVLTETIFGWPGMGQYLVQSTYRYDFPAVQGAFFLLAILTIVANLFADLLYASLDPRVRLTK